MPKQSSELQKLLNWPVLMKLPREAGGHDDHMKNLFLDASVIAHYNSGDYQGVVVTCLRLADGRFVVFDDYYGSCSGCDAWEDASDEDISKLCIDLANRAYIFDTRDDVKQFLSTATLDQWHSVYQDLDQIITHMLNELEKAGPKP